ncbi:plasmid mobilization protein [Metamycoplasma gateae]
MKKNLYRNKQKNIGLTEEELKIIEDKFKLSKCRNMQHFIRKCLLEKEILALDLIPFLQDSAPTF